MRISEIMLKCVSILILTAVGFSLTGCGDEKPYLGPPVGRIYYDHEIDTIHSKGGTAVFKVTDHIGGEYRIVGAHIGYRDKDTWNDIYYTGELKDVMSILEEPAKWVKQMDIDQTDGTLTVSLPENQDSDIVTIYINVLRINSAEDSFGEEQVGLFQLCKDLEANE